MFVDQIMKFLRGFRGIKEYLWQSDADQLWLGHLMRGTRVRLVEIKEIAIFKRKSSSLADLSHGTEQIPSIAPHALKTRHPSSLTACTVSVLPLGLYYAP